ncbi:MAG: SRPBCC family protein [Ilumatobacteraceae bacterium]
MRNVTIERTVAAPRASVWAVLADYPNIVDWNDGISKSYAIGDAIAGVGAQRQCELAPNGKMTMRETVAEWVPEEKMVIDIDQMEKMPVKSATMTFTLADGGDSTPFTMAYAYDPKGGFLASIFGPLMDRQMKKGFNGFVDSLEPAAQDQAAT